MKIRVMVDTATILQAASDRATAGPADETQFDEQARTLHELGYRIVGRDDHVVQVRQRLDQSEKLAGRLDDRVRQVQRAHVPGDDGHCLECSKAAPCRTSLMVGGYDEVPF